MSRAEFFQNADFREYVRMLGMLHQLIRRNQPETPEADELREAMDGPVLNPEEVAEATAISADFSQFSRRKTWIAKPVPAAARAGLQQVADDFREGRQFEALRSLRARKGYLPPHQVAYSRGRIWSKLGFPNIAAEYFLTAAESEENANYRYMYLHELAKADPEQAVREAREMIANADVLPGRVLLKSADIMFHLAQRSPKDEAFSLFKEIVPTFETAIQRLWYDPDPTEAVRKFQSHGYCLLGLCHQNLGDAKAALAAFDDGLKMWPGFDAILVARGVLAYSQSSDVADLQAAVERKTTICLPYAFLAYDHLTQGRYRPARELCEVALERAPSNSVRSLMFEWLGICDASLGMPPDVARAWFEAAKQLSPYDPRLGANIRAFEASQAGGGASTWTEPSPEELRERFHFAPPSPVAI